MTDDINFFESTHDRLRLGGQIEFYNRYMALTDEERNKLPYEYGDMENAFQHAYTAAKIAKYVGETSAEKLGYIKEIMTENAEKNSNGKTNAFLDTNRDLWNNDMGIKYIREAKARGEYLSNKQIGDYIFNEIIKEKSDFIVNFQIDNRRWDDSANEDNLWEKIREKLRSKNNNSNEVNKNNPELQNNKIGSLDAKKNKNKDNNSIKNISHTNKKTLKGTMTGKAAPIVEEEESNPPESLDLFEPDLKVQTNEPPLINEETVKNDFAGNSDETMQEVIEILTDKEEENKDIKANDMVENLDTKADEDIENQNENNVKNIENRAPKEEVAQAFYVDPYEKYRKMGWKVIEEKTRSEISKDGVGFAYFNRGKVEIMTEDEIYERLFGRFIDEFKEAANNRGYVYKRFWNNEE